jgi:amphiphysin
MYMPFDGSTPDHVPRHTPVDTPYENVQRVAQLQASYSELRNDLGEEVDQIEERIVKPATDARTSIQPLKKVIKKRNDRKVDLQPPVEREVC